ncbi:hypothetical protein ACHAWT_002160, partial [Skeletonema menzelii]
MASLPIPSPASSKRKDPAPADRFSPPSSPSPNLKVDGRTYTDAVSRASERESSFSNRRIVAVALTFVLAFNSIITSTRSFSSLDLLNRSGSSKSINLSASKAKRMTELLESSTIRYYVYDDDKLVLSDYREKAIQDAPKTWPHKWGHRLFDYSRGEIRWIEALERHPQRTQDPCEADFFVVPIPVGAVLCWGQSQVLREAFQSLFDSALFQQHPERHVAAFATTERVFGWNWWGLSDEEMKKFKSTMIVRDSDSLDEWPNSGSCKRELKRSNHKYFSHVFSLGYGGEGSKPSNAYKIITSESWNQKKFWYFYHSRREPSLCNSIHRQILLKNSTQLEMFEHQPFSIGFDILPDEWLERFVDSKFCLIIRGDQPGSRALDRAIRAGCMPLIVSDVLPVFHSLYPKTLQYTDFAVMVQEEDFLVDPIGSLDKAIKLSKPQMEEKLECLRLMQRIESADQPDSLFVPAFAREVVETMKEKGLETGPISSSSLCNSRNNQATTSLQMPSTDAQMLSCLKQILLNKELPIISQSPIHSDGSPRTALNGKGQEVPFLGAQFAHHGDTGDYKRWNKSIQMARAQPMPQLQQGTEESPCIVLEIGAHREAKSSQGHIKNYPNCQYHAYEVIPQFAEELKDRWKSEPRMHVHPYGLAENEMEIKVDVEALNGVSTFVGDLKGGKKENTTITGQIKSFDFALSEIGQLYNRTADTVIPTLLDINCEGCEYNLLLQAKKHGFIERVPILLIGWHAYGNDGVGSRAWELCQVRAMLSETHEMVYGLGFGWE